MTTKSVWYNNLFESIAICLPLPRCLGTTQHLRDKYSGGYILQVILQMGSQDVWEERLESLNRYVTGILPDARLSSDFEGRAMYKIPNTSIVSLSLVFRSLEKGNFLNENWTISDILKSLIDDYPHSEFGCQYIPVLAG